MPYQWSKKLGSYRDLTTGRFVARDEVLQFVEASVNASTDAVLTITRHYQNQVVPVTDWERLMRQELKKEHIRQYILGRGGREQMTFKDWGSIGNMLRSQYSYLRNFAKDLESGKVVGGAALNRAKMYPGAAREAYERGHRRAEMAKTDAPNEVFWGLGVAEHCFPAGTMISIPSGKKPIESLCVGDLVQTRFGDKRILRLYKHVHFGKLIRLVARKQQLECTPNHPVLTLNGWTRADDIHRTGKYFVLLQDSDDSFNTHIAFPYSLDGITTFTKIYILRSVTFVLRKLHFIWDGIIFRMTMPIDSVGLYDKSSYSDINNEQMLYDHRTFEFDTKFVENTMQSKFQFGRFISLRLIVTQALEAFCIFGRVFCVPFANFVSAFLGIHRIISFHVFRSVSIMEIIERFLRMYYMKFVRSVTDLRFGFAKDFGNSSCSFVGIMLPEIRDFICRPFSTITPFALGINTVCPLSANSASRTCSLSNGIVSVTTNYVAESLLRIRSNSDRLSAMLANFVRHCRFVHSTPFVDNDLIHIYPKGISNSVSHEDQCVTVYNLEVEDVHEYIANGFVVHNCDGCLGFNAMGWQPINEDPYDGAFPGSGDTVCLTNCKCDLRYRYNPEVV